MSPVQFNRLRNYIFQKFYQYSEGTHLTIYCQEIVSERNHLLPAILKMTSSFNVRQKQRAVIAFLVLEGEPQ